MIRVGGLAFLAAFLLAPAVFGARAEDAAGCDATDWPLVKERQLLAAPDLPRVDAGAEVGSGTRALALSLEDADKAQLPVAPSRPARSPSPLASYFRLEAISAAGDYLITLSDKAWIDVIQDGQILTPEAHTSAHNCPGLGKSLRYSLEAAPLTVEISDAEDASIRIAITPAESPNSAPDPEAHQQPENQ